MSFVRLAMSRFFLKEKRDSDTLVLGGWVLAGAPGASWKTHLFSK